MNSSPETQWWYGKDGESVGPFALRDIEAHFPDGIPPTTPFWDGKSWANASSIQVLGPFLIQPEIETQPEESVSGKLGKLQTRAREHLDPGETVIASVLGAYETEIMGRDSVRNGILMATNKRLLFYAKKMTGYDLESFPYSNISSFQISKNMLGHALSFFSSGNQIKLKWIQKGNLSALVDHVKASIGNKNTPPTVAGSDLTEQLKKLSELRDLGVLTPEEFEAKKKEILARI